MGYRFGEALTMAQDGKRMTRGAWPEGSFIFQVPGSTFQVSREPLLSILGEGTEVEYHPHIDVRLPGGTIAVWTPSQPDMAAHDWFEVG